MYIKLGGSTYHNLKNLSFSPQTDLTGLTLPINEYTVDVVTYDDLVDLYGHDECILYDDMDNVWADYFLEECTRVDEATVHIRACSVLKYLDSVTLEPRFYDNVNQEEIVRELFGKCASMCEESDLIEVYGFCPEQTARERLQWILLSNNLRFVDVFRMGFAFEPEFPPVHIESRASNARSADARIVTKGQTFYEPKRIEAREVTAIRVTYYTYREAEDEEEWSEEGGFEFPYPWIVEEGTDIYYNPDVPVDTPENVIEVKGVYILSAQDAAGIEERLRMYCFRTDRVRLDCMNNRGHVLPVPSPERESARFSGSIDPAMRVLAPISRNRYGVGAVESCAYDFGVQTRSTVEMIVNKWAEEWRDCAYLQTLKQANRLRLPTLTYNSGDENYVPIYRDRANNRIVPVAASAWLGGWAGEESPEAGSTVAYYIRITGTCLVGDLKFTRLAIRDGVQSYGDMERFLVAGEEPGQEAMIVANYGSDGNWTIDGNLGTDHVLADQTYTRDGKTVYYGIYPYRTKPTLAENSPYEPTKKLFAKHDYTGEPSEYYFQRNGGDTFDDCLNYPSMLVAHKNVDYGLIAWAMVYGRPV